MDAQDQEVEMDANQEEAPACCQGCFGVFKSPWKQSSSENEGKRELEGGNSTTKEVTWWKKKVNKARELTEGPKWKKLVRKIGAYCRKQQLSLCKKQKPKNMFQYDLNSYNLNFDDGSDGENPVADFAARFASASSFVFQKGPVLDHQ